MKKTLTATLVLGLASSATAQPLALRGSDTLYQITQQMLTLCNVPSSTMVYVGGGSSGGQNAMRDGDQAIAPMSRFINTSGCGLSAPNDNGEGYAHSLDAIGVLGDDTEDTDCDTLRYTGTLAVQDLNGTAGLQCPNCTGSDYTFTQWQQVLRIVYAGRHGTINTTACFAGDPAGLVPAGETKECNSDVRNTLVNNWSNLFEGGCTDGECTQLKHAFRRDDISGTTDTFLSLLSLPGVGSTPFCNGNEFEDLDPIRRLCDGNGQSTGGENVCSRTRQAIETGKATPTNARWAAVTSANSPTNNQGDLGLVLSMVIPTALADQYPNSTNCSALPFGGQFRGAAMPFVLGSPQLCPNGQPRSLNTCLWPVDPTGKFGCVNAAANIPSQRVTGFNFDGRVYNLTQRRADTTGSIPTEPRVINSTEQQLSLVNTAYYRIHQNTLMANASGSTCRRPDSTEQIGCLVHASPCSLGFSGLTADLQDPNKLLSLGAPAGGQAIAPSEETVRRLLSTCENGFGTRYPLSRKLYFNTLVGFANIPATNQQDRFAKCWADRRLVDRAALAAGFITLGDDGCDTAALPANPGVDAPPAQCNLADDVPGTEIESCP
jgi:hypothetical protein